MPARPQRKKVGNVDTASPKYIIELHATLSGLIRGKTSRGISHREFSTLLPARIRKNRKLRRKAIALLQSSLSHMGIVLVSTQARVILKRQAARIAVRKKPKQKAAPKPIVLPEELKQLAVRRSSGRHTEEEAYVAACLQHARILDLAEEHLLFQRYKKGDLAARDQLVLANAKIALFYARKYRFRSRNEFVDLLGEALLRMFSAVDRYNPKRGARFATYCHIYARQACLESLRNLNHVVRPTRSVLRRRKEIFLAEQRWWAQFGCRPTPDDLASLLGWKVDRVYQALQDLNASTISLDEPVSTEEDSSSMTVGALFVDSRVPAPDAEIKLKRSIDAAFSRLRAILKTLERSFFSPKDRLAFQLRYGLDGTGEIRTLRNVAETIGVSESRASQIIGRIWSYASRGESRSDESPIVRRKKVERGFITIGTVLAEQFPSEYQAMVEMFEPPQVEADSTEPFPSEPQFP
jgi:RNA polymerase sigma factor (sigma-70 family)